MEFDYLFTLIQGKFKTRQRLSIPPFDRVTKENDRQISTGIVSDITDTIHELNLSDVDKRKIQLFFFVNTDFPSISTLEEDPNFWHLLGTLPKLSDYLYFQIVTKLNLHSYVGEAIYMCPEYLSIEILNAIDDHLRTINRDVAISFIYSVCENTFWKINSLCIEKKPKAIILEFVKAYKHIVSFNIEEYIEGLDFEQLQKYIYFGYTMKMMLNLLTSSISIMKSGSLKKNIDIYDFSIEYDYSKWSDIGNEINWVNHCLGLLVGKCVSLVSLLNVNMYMDWCEEDINGCEGKTLQTGVREAAYHCLVGMESISDLQTDICGLKALEKRLNTISLKPVTEEDKIMKADISTIVQNLSNPGVNQEKWLKGLISTPGVFDSCDYTKVIKDNAHMINIDLGKLLLCKLLDYLSTSTCLDKCELAKDCFFSYIKSRPVSFQLELLSYYFEHKYINNVLKRRNYNEALVIVSNKLTSVTNDSEILSDVISLCFEDPKTLINTCIRDCLKFKSRFDVFTNLLSNIQPLASVSYSNSSKSFTLEAIINLLDVVIDFEENERDNFIEMMEALCSLDFIDRSVFFPVHVMWRFKESIKEGNIIKIQFYLDLLPTYLSTSCLPEDYVTLLTFLVTFLDKMRPPIHDYSSNKMLVASKAAELVEKLTNLIVKAKTEPDQEIQSLQTMSMSLQPVTRMHLVELWSHWGNEIPDLPYWLIKGFGHTKAFRDKLKEDRFQLISITIKLLPILTRKEWLYLFGSPTEAKTFQIYPVADMLIDVIEIFLQLPIVLKNVDIANDIIKNFIYYFWDVAIRLKMDDTNNSNDLLKKKSLLNSLSTLRNNLPDLYINAFQSLINFMKENIDSSSEISLKN